MAQGIPFLSQMMGCFQDRTDMIFVLAYETNGSLGGLLEKHRVVDVEFARNLIIDMLIGINFLHANNIIHGDLKPDNILIDRNYRGIVGDFGMCKVLTQTGFTGRWGTEVYESPEQLNDLPWDQRVDIFAIGIMFLEMVSGAHPFYEGANSKEDVLSNIRRLIFRMPQCLELRAISFVKGMVCSQNQRLTVAQAVNHKYIKHSVQEALSSFVWPEKLYYEGPPGETYYNHTSFFRPISGVDFDGDDWGPQSLEQNLDEPIVIHIQMPASADVPAIAAVPAIEPVRAITPVPAIIAPVPAIIAPVPAIIAPVPAIIAPVPAIIAPVPAIIAPVPAIIAPVPDNAPLPANGANIKVSKTVRKIIRKQLKNIEQGINYRFEIVRTSEGYYVICNCGKHLKVTCQTRGVKQSKKYSVQSFKNHFKKH